MNGNVYELFSTQLLIFHRHLIQTGNTFFLTTKTYLKSMRRNQVRNVHERQYWTCLQWVLLKMLCNVRALFRRFSAFPTCKTLNDSYNFSNPYGDKNKAKRDNLF